MVEEAVLCAAISTCFPQRSLRFLTIAERSGEHHDAGFGTADIHNVHSTNSAIFGQNRPTTGNEGQQAPLRCGETYCNQATGLKTTEPHDHRAQKRPASDENLQAFHFLAP